MRITIITIILSLSCLWSCTSEDALLKQFEKCYPKEKLEIINQAVKKLDQVVLLKYPAKNMNDSYKKYGEDWISKGYDMKPLLKKQDIKSIGNQFRENDLLDDFFVSDNKGYNYVNFKGDYIQCLKKLKDEKIKNYIRVLDESGTHWPYTFIFSAFVEQDQQDLKSLHLIYSEVGINNKFNWGYGLILTSV